MMPLSRTGWSRTGLAASGGLMALVTACGSAGIPAAGGGIGGAGHTAGHTARHGHSAGQGHPAGSGHTTGSTHAGSGSASKGSGSKGSGHRGSGSGGSGPGGSAAGSAGTAAGGSSCQSGNLGVTAGASQGTAGSVYATVTFTNHGAKACTLYGYPGVSLGTGTPFHQAGMAAAENPSPPRELVTLAPGGVASSVLQIADAGNYPAGQCRPKQVSELQVYPPNQTLALRIPYRTTGCSGQVRQLTVSVVQPGHAPQA